MTDDDYQTLGNRAKVNPPLRFEEDREALWSGINEGLIDCVATDHAPHTLEEKDREYKNVPSGMPGVEMSVPLLLDAVNRDKISLQQFIALTSTHPAEILGLKTKGKIEMEFDADLTIVDMNEERAVGEKKYFTKCNWSPYEGRKLKGWPKMTIVGGKVVFQDGLLVGEPTGKELLKN